MAHTLAPALNQTLRLAVIPSTQNESIVVVNGQRYKFTIIKDTTDITQKIDGRELASRVTEFFLQDTGQRSIETGELVLTGDFNDLETATTVTRKTVSLISSSAEYIEGTKTKRKVLRHDSLSPAVENHLRIIGESFASIRPLSPSPSNSTAISTNPPVVVDLTGQDLIEVDASGQCADASLAHQILTIAKETNLLTSNKPNVDAGAVYLRKAAAELIEKDKRFDIDPIFANYLENSIRNIRGVVLPDTIRNILVPNRMITSVERATLRTFYARYIAEENARKMTNFLDAAFFYVLPKIDVPADHALTLYFPNGFHCAIVQNGAIVAQYPTDTELNSDWLIIWYDGINHYKAVNMERAETKAKIEKIITTSQNKLLNEDLLNFANTAHSSAIEVKRRLQQEVRVQNQSAYNKIAGAIYEYDLHSWENSDRSLPQPGTVDLEFAGQIYTGAQYGDYRIDSTSPEELKTILNTLHQANKI